MTVKSDFDTTTKMPSISNYLVSLVRKSTILVVVEVFKTKGVSAVLSWTMLYDNYTSLTEALHTCRT